MRMVILLLAILAVLPSCGGPNLDSAMESAKAKGALDSLWTAYAVAADRRDAIGSWDAVKTLEVQVDRLERWHAPGLLLIGDAAHAMSPIGGVGINMAIQDAVAAANALAGPLRGGGDIDESLLARIQQRREWPVKVVQRVQLAMQKRLISRVLEKSGDPPRVPALLRFLLGFRTVRHLPARLFGYGLRQEHVRTPALIE